MPHCCSLQWWCKNITKPCGSADRQWVRPCRRRLSALLRPLVSRRHRRPSQDFTSWLPDEILVNILSLLPPRDLLNAADVCQRWSAVAADDGVWRRCCRRLGLSLSDGAVSWRELGVLRFVWADQPLPPPSKLEGVTNRLRCLAADGDRLIMYSEYKGLAVWSASSGRVQHWLGHLDGVISCIKADADLVVVGSHKGTLTVWRATTGCRLHVINAGYEGRISSLAMRGTRAVSGSEDRTILLWDLESGSQQAVLRGHATCVVQVCFDGRWISSGDRNGCVRLWNPETHAEEAVWQTGGNLVTTLEHGFGVVVSGHENGVISVLDMTTRRVRFEMRGDRGYPPCFSLHEDRLLAGYEGGALMLWDLSSGRCLHSWGSDRDSICDRVSGVRLLAGLAVASSYRGWVRVWDCRSGTLLREMVSTKRSGSHLVHRLWVSPNRLTCSVNTTDDWEWAQVLFYDMSLRQPPET